MDDMNVDALRVAQHMTHNFGAAPPTLSEVEPVEAGADYDVRTAYLCSVIAGWAYADTDTLGEQLPYYGLQNATIGKIQVVNRAMLVVALAYFVRTGDGRVGFLAFRGTMPDDIISWLTDADTSLLNFHFGRVHSGFYQNLRPLWGKIAKNIELAVSPDQDNSRMPLENLYICGHSLGGAMAVIAAARIFANDYQDWQPLLRGVYTFGQPAVGDRTFGEHFGNKFKLYRHVYRNDAVPRLPPESFGPYAHFGDEFYSTEDGWQYSSRPYAKLVRSSSKVVVSSAFDFLSRRLTPLQGLRLPYSLDDHNPLGYIATSRKSV